MKKFVIAALAALMCVGLNAQSFTLSEDGTPVIDSDSWSMWSEDSSFGWGYHVMIDGDSEFLDYTTSFGRNREIFFSLIGGEFRPVKYLGLSGCIDLNWDTYRLKKGAYYWEPDGNGAVAVKPLEGSPYSKVRKSVLRSFGFDFPVQLKIHLGDVCIAGGIVGELNLPGVSFSKLNDQQGGKLKVKENVNTNLFTYSYRASITYAHLGIYGKYSPCSQFEQGFGPQFSYWTVGLILY